MEIFKSLRVIWWWDILPFLLESLIAVTDTELPSPYLAIRRHIPFETYLYLCFSELRSLGHADSHSSLVGYCPQEDALDDLVSVEEHLYFYARIHGIPEKDIKEVSISVKTSSFENHYCFCSLLLTVTTKLTSGKLWHFLPVIDHWGSLTSIVNIRYVPVNSAAEAPLPVFAQLPFQNCLIKDHTCRWLRAEHWLVMSAHPPVFR